MGVRRIVVIVEAEKPKGRHGENWRPIPGFDGYEASDQGRVRSVDRKIRCRNRLGNLEWRLYKGKILSPSKTGYPHVQIGKGNYNYSGEDVHKLVMLAFVGPRPSRDHEIAHYDGVSANNHLSNLRYVTYQENHDDTVRHGRANRGEHHYASKLTKQQVRKIRQSAASNSDLAKKYGMSITTIHQIRHRLTWRWLDANRP